VTVDGVKYIDIIEMFGEQSRTIMLRNVFRALDVVNFIRSWETVNNPNYIGPKPSFNSNDIYEMSGSEIKKYNVKSVVKVRGFYGGTYVHPDLAYYLAYKLDPRFAVWAVRLLTENKDLLNRELMREIAVKFE
jgi:hypothetical protein